MRRVQLVALGSLVGVGACQNPQGQGDDTSTGTTTTGTASSTSSGTSSTTGTGTGTSSGAPAPCAEPDFLLEGVCLQRHDLLDAKVHILAKGDANADGRVDLILDNRSTPQISILYVSESNEITLSAPATRTIGGSSYEQIFVANFDGTPEPEIGIKWHLNFEIFPVNGGNPGASSVVTFATNNVIQYATAVTMDPAMPARLFVGDIPGVRFWRREGDQWVQDGVTYGVPECGVLTDVQSADFNGDGLPDVVMIADDRCGDKNLVNLPMAEGRVLLAREDHTVGMGKAFQTGTSPIQIATGDFNGDGIVDLAALNRESEDVSILLGVGTGAFEPQVRFSVGERLEGIAAGDVDGDGMDELVVVTRQEGALLLVHRPHDAQTIVPMTTDVFQPVMIADLNGDGRAEVAVRSRTEDSHLILFLSVP